jgi:hypothetical protein
VRQDVYQHHGAESLQAKSFCDIGAQATTAWQLEQPAVPVYLALVDVCCGEEALELMRSALQAALEALPPAARFGLITYSSRVSLLAHDPELRDLLDICCAWCQCISAASLFVMSHCCCLGMLRLRAA